MKNLILLSILALSLSFRVNAENWVSISKLGTGQAFQLKQECESVTGQKCFDLGDLPSSVYSVIQVDVDDYKKPIYSKSQVSDCTNEEDCSAKMLALVCIDKDETPIKNYELLQIYCTKLVGYEQKKKDVISLDEAKKSAYDSAQVLKAQKELQEKAIQVALKKIDCGKRVIASLLVRNASKGLTVAQVDQMNTTFAPIKNRLETGSLETAKSQIIDTTPDGTIVTEQDKTALVQILDECK